METPDTWNYFWLTVLGLYVFSLWARQRNLERDLKVLQSLENSEKKPGD